MLTDGDRTMLVDVARQTPARHAPGITTVYHYSEDGTIRRFAPHVPPTNPGHPAAVWAIDESHSPLYWFPRHCPRISVWAHDDDQQVRLSETFQTEASRICAAETGWLERVRDARLYRYSFDAATFRPWVEADGQYIADEVVYPDHIDRIDDVFAEFADADIELRFTPRMGTLMDRILESRLPFSFVRIRDARR